MKDPFAQYKLRFKRKEMSFLTADELSKIENIELSKKIKMLFKNMNEVKVAAIVSIV